MYEEPRQITLEEAIQREQTKETTKETTKEIFGTKYTKVEIGKPKRKRINQQKPNNPFK